MPELLDNEQTGVLAAWRYLQLAWQALTAPITHDIAQHVPHTSLATRLYLIFNSIIYLFAASAFLLTLRGFHVKPTGLPILDIGVLHALWGFSALFVALSQVAALLSDRWIVWQVCTVATSTWATFFGLVLLYEAHVTGAYGGVVFWWWLVGVHFLFISNQLAPHHPRPPSQEQASPHPHHPASHTVEEEQALLEAVEHEVTKPPPPKPPKLPTAR